ncbi:MAG: AGE family epimerase/isomerase [Muribaculaceae bacterium]|nr:AGE family epimerase/isomerase [Muribaculaceae bacterium]
MPFWLKYGLDPVNGGVYTCLDRDGALMDSTKSVWFQGRFGYVAAAAYRFIEQNPEWLAASKSCIDFIEAHCIDPKDGRMYFEVTADGRPLRKRRYVFSECFAAIAMSEYSLASGDKTYAEKALKLFKDIRRFISTPGILEPKYMETQPAIGHSITMILINTAARIREAIPDPVLDEQIAESIERLKLFIHPEFKALLETVTPAGELIDTCAGRTINPGHCIETAWFLLEESKYRGWDPELTRMALQILDWSWDWGWDPDFGGIINFRDCKGFPCQDYSQDMKFWWPQTEAVIATLYAYQASGDEKYLRWHKMAHDWMMAHLPDPEYPEWFGYLHRDGSVAQPAKGNIFKGPFHIPRMLIKSIQLLNE